MMDDSAAPAGDFALEGAVSKYRTTALTMAFSSCNFSRWVGVANKS
jgi:hypothetical protein